MKILLSILVLLFFSSRSFSQTDTIATVDTNMYRIVLNDGSQFLAKILKNDNREILIRTQDKREIFIPQYAIKNIELLKASDLNAKGDFIGEDKFATRYFITTNGLPIKKGEHYVQWNLFGPDFQFGVGKNLGVGIMTSWLGIPMIASVKKSFQLNENTHLALGALVGSATWAAPTWGGALPFATLSLGNRKSNIAFSGGYGAIFTDGDTEGRALMSIAGMTKISSKLSLVFDSFILPPLNQNDAFALLIPGIRWHQDEGRSMQFGFTGIIIDGEIVPVPIPMVQWYRSL